MSSPSPRQRLTPFNRLPLQVIFIITVIGQLIGAVGLVGYFSFQNGQKAVQDLATQLRRELSARTQKELESYFATPHEINRLNADSFAKGNLDILTSKRGESQLYQQMVIAPTVAFVYCGSEQNGEFFGVIRSPQDGSLQLSYSNRSTQYRRSYYSLNASGDRTFFVRQIDKVFDARQRPWYKRAVSAERAAWTDIYIAFTTGLPNITAALPVYDKSEKRLLGVCATDVVLPEEFRAFLRNLQVGRNGQVFVLDRQGHLIADSTNDRLMIGEGDNAKLLPAIASKTPLVRETAQYLKQQFGNLNSILESQQLEFQLDRQSQYLQVVPFRDRYGLDWLIVVVVPESDFMAQIHANTQNTIGLCIGTMGLAIAVGIFTSRWITRPILQIAQAADKLAQGEPPQPLASSPIGELDALTSSFNTMATQLKSSFDALRQSEATKDAILTTIPDLMIHAKSDGTYLDIISRDRQWGIHSVRAFNPGDHVLDVLPPDLAELRLHYIQQALTTGKLQIYEQRIPIENEIWDEEVRILVLREDEVLIMVRNITDRKRAEEALRITEENYRSIFENALEGIFQSTPEGRFIRANPALARIYGYDSPAEMMSQITNIAEQLYVEPENRDRMKALLEAQDAVKDFEYSCYRKDGSIIWTQIDARVVRGSNSSILYYEGIVQDITDRKRQEDELKRQLEELKVEIDQNKRETEVAMLTESNYFLEVQKEMAEVNLDEFWS
jgi:PAS domain S-box-containing protein